MLDDESTSVFVHNDIHFENVFIDQGKLVGIIDFDRWSKAPPHYELSKFLDFVQTPSWYVEDRLESKYKNSLVDAAVWLKKYYPNLFVSPYLTDKVRLYFVDTVVWLLRGYNKGKWRKSVINEIQQKFKILFQTDWLEQILQ